MRIAEFEPPVMIRRPSGVYANTVVPGVSVERVVNTRRRQSYQSSLRAGRPRGRRASKLISNEI